MPGWMKHKLESRLPQEISVTSDVQMTPPLWQKAKQCCLIWRSVKQWLYEPFCNKTSLIQSNVGASFLLLVSAKSICRWIYQPLNLTVKYISFLEDECVFLLILLWLRIGGGDREKKKKKSFDLLISVNNLTHIFKAYSRTKVSQCLLAFSSIL